jgi:hypothetical protein
VFAESLHSDGRGAERSEFIVALLVAQQRAINTRTSIVACRFNVFTESLPRTALAIHVTVLKIWIIKNII